MLALPWLVNMDELYTRQGLLSKASRTASAMTGKNTQIFPLLFFLILLPFPCYYLYYNYLQCKLIHLLFQFHSGYTDAKDGVGLKNE